MIIKYSQNGLPVSDWDVDNAYGNIRLCQNPECVFEFSTENIFNRIRLGVVLGEMDCHDVLFMFNDDVIELNRYGVYEEYLDGFLDANTKIIESILITQIAIYQKEKSLPNRVVL